jgi:hypothetical protein
MNLQSLYEQILPYIPWIGMALLIVLCLPLSGIQKLILELYALALRLALLGLVAAGAYLWFYPDDLPTTAAETFNSFPLMRENLPAPGTRAFGFSIAGFLMAALLPVLAVLDVSRKLAGVRLRRLRVLAAKPIVVQEALPAANVVQRDPGPRRIDRRAAADTLAQASSRKPYRATDDLGR